MSFIKAARNSINLCYTIIGSPFFLYVYQLYAGITCPPPQEGINTVPIPPAIQDGMFYLETYVYQCLPGHKTEDDKTTTCHPDGSLSVAVPPNCTGMCIFCRKN